MVDYTVSKIKNSVDDLDVYIGKRVKLRRSFLGISQEKLGGHLGITFQQVQKYEKGINRISASTLFYMAYILSVDLSYFFEGCYSNNKLNEDGDSLYDLDKRQRKEIQELLRFYNKIVDPAVRKKALELMKIISSLPQKKEDS